MLWVRMRKEEIFAQSSKEECLLDVFLTEISVGWLEICPYGQKTVQGSWRDQLLTSMTLNNFVTTVATPLKKVGRLWPSI